MKKIFLMVILLLVPSYAYANDFSEEQLDQTIQQIIDWKKQEQQIPITSPLLQNPFLQQAGTTNGDWYPFAIGRAGVSDDYDGYLAVIEEVVEKRYKEIGGLDATKATEWHRIALTILALGGDPTNIGGRDLIADGTYNRGLQAPLDLQGVNGLIWGLIALDSMRYEVPANAVNSRQEIIQSILAAQLEDGGFSFYHDTADADITAMALQALAPYANSFERFTYTKQATNKTVTKTVRQVIEEALDVLQTLQLPTGDFGSWGEANAESTAQVLVALSALQIDPLTDERFIKNGNTIIDGLLRYAQADGGFIHSETYNSDNPTSLPDVSNSMASEQVLYAFIAYKRALHDYRALYDFRPEMTPDIKQQVAQVEQLILASPLSNEKDVQQILTQFLQIPASEAMYVDHFEKLYDAVQTLSIDVEPVAVSQEIGSIVKGNGTVIPLFDTLQLVAVNPEEIAQFLNKESYTTDDLNTVLRYIRYAEENQHENLASLQTVKETITNLQNEINALNKEILENIYPISAITLDDRELAENIFERFSKLAESDQKKIVNYEDLQQINAILDSQARELRIKSLLIGLTFVLIGFFIVRKWKKRREASL